MTQGFLLNADLLASLKSSPDQLETHLLSLQVGFEAGSVSESDLDYSFKVFMTYWESVREPLQHWLQQKPDSYVVVLANAYWFFGQAWKARGHDVMDKTSDRGQQGMIYFSMRARALAEQSCALSAKPVSSFVLLGEIMNTFGAQLTLEHVQKRDYPDWFTNGLRVAPNSLLLRQTMLRSLRSEWGGSEEAMQAFVHQQEHDGIHQQDVQQLKAQLYSHIGHYESHFKKNLQRAEEMYNYSLGLDRGKYLLNAAVIPAFSNDVKGIVPLVVEKLRLERDNPRYVFGSQSALVDVVLAKAPEYFDLAYPIFKRAALGGDLEAAFSLGELIQTCKRNDVESSEHWYGFALAEGHAPAAKSLYDLGSKLDQKTRLGYVLQGAELGDPEMAKEVWSDFKHFAKVFDFHARDEYKFLAGAAYAGNNLARCKLASLLERGRDEFGEDGILRPIHGKPLPKSVEHARYLYERASNHPQAARALARLHLSGQGGASRDLGLAARHLSTGLTRDWRFWWYGGIVVLILVRYMFRG